MASCAGTDSPALAKYMKLSQGNKIQAEYIWIGGSGIDIRSKTKTITGPLNSIDDLPEWNYDGSSTNQASGNDSEVWLKPVKMVPDPFRLKPNVLVLCETIDPKTMTPLKVGDLIHNRRSIANKIFSNKLVKDEAPWYGIEQEYTLFESGMFLPYQNKKQTNKQSAEQ